jgi:hypothetical protein
MKTIQILQPDWHLLRQQKEWLLVKDTSPWAEGLTGLIDHIQDAAVSQGVATELEVFGDEE